LNMAPGDYTLFVRGAAASTSAPRELGQYPFKLEH
jgi:hypothetical protein